MEKVFIKDDQGNKVLPITHTSAVLDDSGNDIGSVMGAFEDEVRGLVDTPHQNYVTVATYASLPAQGSADTIYRVSNYNGSTSQVDVTSYSQYAWNGTQYVFLCVKSQIGEVFDITVYNSNTKYADLAAALGTNGANIPQSLRKGGMSVKFVQSSDNKYVQFRLMNNQWSSSPFDWKVDDNCVVVAKLPAKRTAVPYATEETPHVSRNTKIDKDGVRSTAQSYFIRDAIKIEPLATVTLNNGAATYHGENLATVFLCDSSGNWIKTLVTKPTGQGGNYVIPPITNNTAEDLYIGYCSMGIGSSRYYLDTYEETASKEDNIKDWVLSESYTITGATYTDGVVNSPIAVTWPDATSGTLTIVRNNDGLVTSITASYGTSTYVLTITRNSDGNATDTTIIKQ